MSELGYEYNRVEEVRTELAEKFENAEFSIDRLGSKTIEILGASFEANEDHIFGIPSAEYISKELEWYTKCSTNINDIYGKEREAPQAWCYAANNNGEINSNYGYLIYSPIFYNQYDNVVRELTMNPDSRRGTMVYNRPSIWAEFNDQGKSDFICTNAVSYYIRDGHLETVVQMRSNDLIYGYRNDFAWAVYVRDKLINSLQHSSDSKKLEPGNFYWQVQNAHIYEKHFYMIDHYIKTGESSISLKDYKKLYPNSEWI